MDLNKLKNYTNFSRGATSDQQFDKVLEELHEYEDEIINKNVSGIIAEGLDVMTAVYNHLIKVGMTEQDFNKHIEKLEQYRKTGKYGGLYAR